ncbi:helix-turn-helix transcriptional regulator [Herbaspirillum lusitanum]|jgi:transcriptional regulator with XRE-family HTH domain|uniref:Helix-turn-helix transcriptional regulator n=1 Tax=Herbaspirillum lusitanum TaxID=213312 RepID=A0ABW9AGR6_9BURK
MITLGQRLKEERKRLALTQPEFALAGGVEKATQINYEQDKRAPNTDYLVAIAGIGVDIGYVLLGIPSSAALPEDEAELLVGYRRLDMRNKTRVLGVIEGILEAEKPVLPARQASDPAKANIARAKTGKLVGKPALETADQASSVARKKK